MQKVDLRKVLDMLVNEEQEGAEGLLHQWFVEKTKSIHENLMQEDDDILEDDNLTKSIEDDQNDIEAEEYFGEDDLGTEDEDESEDPESVDAAANANATSDIENDDFDNDRPDGEMTGDASDMSTDPQAIQDQFADLQSDLARLKAEFTKLTGGDQADSTPDMDSDPDADMANMSAPTEESLDEDDFDDLDESRESDKEKMAKLRAKKDGKKTEDDNLDESSESNKEKMAKLRAKKDNKKTEDNDLDDLDESFMLEPVASAGLNTPRYSGDGGKVVTHNKSPIPQNAPDKRVGGRAVEIRSEVHKGVEREMAPKVKQNALRKNQIKSTSDSLEAVGSLGPKNALLNRSKEIYPDKQNNKSLLGSTGSDLRGNFMKRK